MTHRWSLPAKAGNPVTTAVSGSTATWLFTGCPLPAYARTSFAGMMSQSLGPSVLQPTAFRQMGAAVWRHHRRFRPGRLFLAGCAPFADEGAASEPLPRVSSKRRRWHERALARRSQKEAALLKNQAISLGIRGSIKTRRWRPGRSRAGSFAGERCRRPQRRCGTSEASSDRYCLPCMPPFMPPFMAPFMPPAPPPVPLMSPLASLS